MRLVISGKVVDLPAPKPFQSASSEAGESKMLMEAGGHYSLEPQPGYLVPDTGPCHPWAPVTSPSPQYGHQSPSYQTYFQFPPTAPHNCYGGVDNLVKVG